MKELAEGVAGVLRHLAETYTDVWPEDFNMTMLFQSGYFDLREQWEGLSDKGLIRLRPLIRVSDKDLCQPTEATHELPNS